MPNFCPNCGHQLTEMLEPANSPVMIIDEKFVFDFGKHKGLSVREILEINPTYLFWVNRNIEYLEVPDEILSQCNVKPNKPSLPRSGPGSPWDDRFYDDLDDDVPF